MFYIDIVGFGVKELAGAIRKQLALAFPTTNGPSDFLSDISIYIRQKYKLLRIWWQYGRRLDELTALEAA